MPKSCLKKKNNGFDLETANFIVAMYKSDFYTENDICRTAGISRSTLFRWKRNHPEFKAAIENAKHELHERMESELHARNSLMRRLKGFEITERRIVTAPGDEKDADGNPIPVVKYIVDRTRQIPPDTEAIIFVLTNTEPKYWKRNKRVEVLRSTPGNEYSKMTDEELDAVIARLSASRDAP